jgi:hypothetical protein
LHLLVTYTGGKETGRIKDFICNSDLAYKRNRSCPMLELAFDFVQKPIPKNIYGHINSKRVS